MVLVPFEQELSYTRQSELDRQMSGILKRNDLDDRHKYHMYQKLLETFLRIKNPANNLSQTEPVVTVDANVDTKDLTQMVDVSTMVNKINTIDAATTMPNVKKRNMAVNTDIVNTPIKKSAQNQTDELNETGQLSNSVFYNQLFGDETLNEERLDKSLMNQSLAEPVSKLNNEGYSIPLTYLTPEKSSLANSSQFNQSKLDTSTTTPSYAAALTKKPLLNKVLTSQHNKSTTASPKASNLSSTISSQVKKTTNSSSNIKPQPQARVSSINKATIPVNSKLTASSNSKSISNTPNSPKLAEDGFITQRIKNKKNWSNIV